MNLTTAQILGQYRRELIADGIPPNELEALVHMAARELVADGLRIGDPNACEKCGQRANHTHH